MASTVSSALVRTRRCVDGVARVVLDHPNGENALDDQLAEHLALNLEQISEDAAVRLVVITSHGDSFSVSSRSDLIIRDKLEHLLCVVRDLRQPTLVLINGAVAGDGVGLIACCDLAVAADTAVFSIPAVRHGHVPGVVGRRLMAAIGRRAALRYLLTGERFSAVEARRIGLVHDVVPLTYLQRAGEVMVANLLRGDPVAQRRCKIATRDDDVAS